MSEGHAHTEHARQPHRWAAAVCAPPALATWNLFQHAYLISAGVAFKAAGPKGSSRGGSGSMVSGAATRSRVAGNFPFAVRSAFESRMGEMDGWVGGWVGSVE